MTDVAGRSSHRREPETDRPHVTAVLVSHDGAGWLPQVIAALGAQTRMPDAWVAVDTGSADSSLQTLTDTFGPGDVVALDADTPYGTAVAAGLEHRPPRDDGWVWLLHDDCAPSPEALEALLAEAAAAGSDVSVVGPKVREWPSLRRLLEVGVTLSGTGRRETGLEPGEPDQGQHDVARDVLAVGTAGTLVRADVWRELGGLDPRFGLGDDIDLGWRVCRAGRRVRIAPTAVVFHVEAASRGRRTPGALSGSPRRERRRSALLVLLANCRRLVLPVQLVRLLLGSLLRVLGLLLLKAPRDAWDELRAVGSVYAHPVRLLSARRARSRTAQVSPRDVRRLLPPVWHPYRTGAATLAEVAAGLVGAGRTSVPRAVVETGPVAEEAESLTPEPGPIARLLAHPWASTLLVLTVLALVAVRPVLGGDGQLQGGALLPAPGGGSAWWANYVASWHPAGLGSTVEAPPYAGLLAGFGLLTLGHAGLLVSLLLLLAVPLSALGAHVFLRRLGLPRASRIWAAAVYGATPLLTGSLAQGRLGTVLATVWLPLVAAAAVDLGRTRAEGRLVLWTRRARAGLALGVLVALVPVAYPVALVVAVALLVLSLRPSVGVSVFSALASAVVVLGVPWVLAPWWLLDRVQDPATWWWEAGLADAGVGTLDPGAVGLALGQPGGPGDVVSVWLGAGVVVAALLALARADARSVVLPAWCVGVLGLVLAAVGAGRTVELPVGTVPVWVGFCLVVWWGALLVAAAAGAADLRGRLTGRSFGLSQPVVALTLVAAVVGPVLALAAVVASGLDGPLQRTAPVPVPSYMAGDATTGARPSTLVLADGPDDSLTSTVMRADGWRLGEEPYAAASGEDAVTEALGDLLVSPRTDSVVAMARYGIGYLYAPARVDPDVAAALDTAPGLVRAGAPEGDRAWQLDLEAGQLRLLADTDDETGAVALDIGSAAADGGPPWTATLPAGDGPQRLSVAALPDSGWAATVEGAGAGDIESGDVQTFDVNASSADDRSLVVEHRTLRGWWVTAQCIALGLLLVLALPTRRRRP